MRRSSQKSRLRICHFMMRHCVNIIFPFANPIFFSSFIMSSTIEYIYSVIIVIKKKPYLVYFLNTNYHLHLKAEPILQKTFSNLYSLHHKFHYLIQIQILTPHLHNIFNDIHRFICRLSIYNNMFAIFI